MLLNKAFISVIVFAIVLIQGKKGNELSGNEYGFISAIRIHDSIYHYTVVDLHVLNMQKTYYSCELGGMTCQAKFLVEKIDVLNRQGKNKEIIDFYFNPLNVKFIGKGSKFVLE